METKRYEYSQTLMGSEIVLTLLEPNYEAAHLIFKSIHLLASQLTVNANTSEVISINQAAGQKPVKVSPHVYALIDQAKKASLVTDSCFNVAIGPLVKCWKIGFQGNRVPNQQQIQSLLNLCDPNHVELNFVNQTVYLTKKGMQLDLGAIAKGYIADVVKALIKNQQISSAIINLGGNVLTIGLSPYNPEGNWQVGLKKPFTHNNELIGKIKLQDKAVVTSGIYERYFIDNEKLYHHILNAHNGYPLNNELVSVTVIADSALEADIMTTYLYGLGLKKAVAYLNQHRHLSAIFVCYYNKIILCNQGHFQFELIDTDFKLSHTSFA